MVQRDYVRKKKQSKKNNSRGMLNLLIIIAIVLVILFAAILYFVTTNNSSKPVVAEVKTAPPAVTLPERPQERWTYLKELEVPNSGYSQTPGINSIQSERQQILDSFVNSGKTTTTPTQDSVATNNKWFLQCGSFKDRSNADTIKAKLAMTGINSDIQFSTSLYRVIVGPYKTKNDADIVSKSLKNNGNIGCTTSMK